MYPEISVNLGNLLLSLSDALDLATPSLAFHQQRTAFISWELCKQAGFEKETLERVFLAALLHDIGALSLEEKLAVHNNETTNTEPHCIKGELLFEDIPWLEKASKIGLKTVESFIVKKDGLDEVVFVLFSQSDQQTYINNAQTPSYA